MKINKIILIFNNKNLYYSLLYNYIILISIIL